MDLDPLLTTLGLVLIIEGLMPFLAPARWRRMFSELLRHDDGQIRFFGLICIFFGLILWLGFSG
ncbi:MAG: DUF2065 domain-containing protein [Alphaproteobacteria bacterium]|nr:DUF2065 domain-containing protein [Alphaproteobacteria bacterium]